jgi:hypothetical protein
MQHKLVFGLEIILLNTEILRFSIGFRLSLALLMRLAQGATPKELKGSLQTAHYLYPC